MKYFIKKRLQEAIKHLPYDPKPEMKAASYSSLNEPSHKLDLNKIKFRIAKAASIANQYKTTNPQDNYFISPMEGDGFYQVEFRHDGQIKTKHIRTSGDMNQEDGHFQPSDVGTCKTFQNIARYCFVKAGKNNSAIGTSPAEDAANKALVIFRNEILDFLGDSGYNDEKAADIAKDKMSPKQALHKEKKDLERKIGRRISDSEWSTYQQTGVEPKSKAQISLDPEKAAEFEKRQMMIKAKIDAMKARIKR